MKSIFLASLLLAHTASAVVFTVTDAPSVSIPDGDSGGVVRSFPVVAPDFTIVGIDIDLTISADGASDAYLGDLYVYLTNGDEVAVLVNRPGQRSGVPGGYSDNQLFNVSFSTTAVNDIHSYRVPTTGSHSTALTAPLTGVWQPDGRLIDPNLVLDTDARTAGLEVFAGAPLSGTWSLFVADLSTGASHKLQSWTMHMDTVPEPQTLLLAGAGLLFRRRKN